MKTQQTIEGAEWGASVVSDKTMFQCRVESLGTAGEVYLLTDKETGVATLAAFGSKFVSARFFAENKNYITQKIK